MSVRNTLIALDQALNAALTGAYPDETLSAKAYRMSFTSTSWLRFRRFVDALLFFDRDKARGVRHCQLAYESEQARTQSPPSER